jgi:queuosine precursor transporter
MEINLMNKNLDYLIFIVMLYIAVDLSSMVFAYKIIEIGPILGAASSLIFPLTYSLMDIIAEVYGYQIAKKIIWYGFICDLIFAILTLFISHIPSSNVAQNTAYIIVLGNLLRAVTAQTIGVLSGAFINIYCISKWKKITNGKYFWLRSIGSSTIGEAVMLVISVLIALAGIVTFSKLIRLIAYTYLYKIIFAVIAAPFVNLIGNILKSTIKNKNVISHCNTVNYITNTQDFSPKFQNL